MERYTLTKSQTSPSKWVLTDTEYGVVCTFEEGAFNESQEFTLIGSIDLDVNEIARIMREMGDWMSENHYLLAMMKVDDVKSNARREIGRAIREVRESEGISLRLLAEKCGIAHNHIHRIECGRYNVTVDTLAVILKVLGLRLEVEDELGGYFDEE